MAAHRLLQMSRSQMEKKIVDALGRASTRTGRSPVRTALSANKRVRPVGSDE